MKVKDVIDAVTNERFYSIGEVNEYFYNNYGEWLHPLSYYDKSIEYLQEVDLNDESYYITATILYKCDDGVVGVHGVYYIYEDIDASVFEDLCTAKGYVLTNKQVYSPK